MHDPDGYGKDLDDLLEDFLRDNPPPKEVKAPKRKRRKLDPKYESKSLGNGGKFDFKTRKVTQEEAVRRVNENYKGELEVISEYHTRSLPLRVKCLVCNEEFSTRAENLFRGKFRACKCK